MVNAICGLLSSGVCIGNLSVVGRAYRTNDRLAGFHSTGKSVVVFGERGEFWSRLWNQFNAGVVLSAPILGSVIVVGRLAHDLASAMREDKITGDLSMLGSTLIAHGVSMRIVAHCERAIMANGLLTFVNGPTEAEPAVIQKLSAAGAKYATRPFTGQHFGHEP